MSRKEIKDRFAYSWKTSLVGLGLIASAVVSVFTSGITWVDAIVPISLGLGFLFSKDDWINKIIK